MDQLKSINVSKGEPVVESVTFESIDEETLNRLLKQNVKSGKNSGKPILTGRIAQKAFAEFKKIEKDKRSVKRTIYVEDGVYELKDTHYKEELTYSDGTSEIMETELTDGKIDIYRCIEWENGISLEEEAFENDGIRDDSFKLYAQPSSESEIINKYSKATGLPIIEESLRSEQLFIIYIKANKKSIERQNLKDGSVSEVPIKESKTIKMLYASKEAYERGDMPSMIYMDSINGRSRYSGMFRLLEGDSYVDNSTFRKERGEDGKYLFDTIRYNDIMELLGNLPNKLSSRMDLAINGKSIIPSVIQRILTEENSRMSENEDNLTYDQYISLQ